MRLSGGGGGGRGMLARILKREAGAGFKIPHILGERVLSFYGNSFEIPGTRLETLFMTPGRF